MAEYPVAKVARYAAIAASLLWSVYSFADTSGTRANTIDRSRVSGKRSIRLASFAPSCSELLESIKAQDCLVGVCKLCDVPQSQGVERIGDFNSANLERLTRLKPDMVLTVSGQEGLVYALKKAKFRTVNLPNHRLSDISNNLRILGKLTNHQNEALAQAEAFDSSMQELSKICQSQEAKPSVFFCVWPQPLLTVGKNSFLNEAIAICGGKNVAVDLSPPYPHFSLEKLLVTNPEIVIMPYEVMSQDYVKRSPWTDLKAFRAQHFYFLPKEESDRLQRPSTRVITGLFWLSCKLHPEKRKELSEWFERSRVRQYSLKEGKNG